MPFPKNCIQPSVLLMLLSSVCMQSTYSQSTEQSVDSQWLEARFNEIGIKSVEATSIDDLKLVVLDNDQIVFMSEDGKVLITGQMMNLQSGENLTVAIENRLRRDKLATALPVGLFEFPAENETDRITVITDIDCTYCRRLHNELAQINARGIGVQYLMMPRSGLNTASHEKAVSAACSPSPEQTLTTAMQGELPAKQQCDNSIDQQFELARSLRINATPAIIFESGRMINSYLTPEQISQELVREQGSH